MSTDSVVAIAWDFLKSCVVVPIERGFRYVTSSKSFADRLREEVHNLENEARRVHDLAQVARNNLRDLNDCFAGWRQSADKALEDARKLLDDFDKESKACCYGTLPDPYCRYQFSTKAEADIKAVNEIAQKCIRFRALDDICLIGPAPADPTPARKEGKDATPSTSRTASLSSASTFKSRDSMIQKIMEALASKSNSAVGVYGMGGLGKSTLLDEVETMLREKKSFDWVAKADVSENPDIKTIQGEIANGLGLTRIKEEDTISGRAKLLRQRLEDEERQEKKVLVILDNLWKGLDLKSVGIPCGLDDKVKGCQLLLTSRDGSILREEMGCDEAFQLCELEKAEAKILFERIGGDRVHEDDFKALVDKALDICAGVPFLIVAMAKRFRVASLPQWKDTVKKIEEFTDKRINNLIDQMLQWSYDKLEDEVKSLLRLCVVYGVSKPSLQNLVKYGVGLGIFERVGSMEEVRNRLSSHIRTLQASSLLLDSEDVASFKIHDLVRQFVVSVASNDHPLLVLKDKDKLITELPKDKLNSYRAMCFPYVDMKRLPEELDCSELQIFLLFTNNGFLHVPDSLFNSMGKLMVLNLTGMCLTCSSLPFQFLNNLHTLCLDHCRLEDVTIIGKATRLRILSLVGSNIRRLPKEIGQLVDLRLLDLSDCSQLVIIEPGVLGCLIKLEELYMNSSFDLWNAVEQTPPTNANLIELNNMKSLSTLHLSISNPGALPGNLSVEKLNEYRIQIGFVNWRRRKCKGSTALELNLKPISDVLQKGCIQSILEKTDDLLLSGLDALVQSICVLSQKGFPQLKHLNVKHSPSVRYIIERSSLPAFKKLETLFLRDLVNLEKICHSHISITSFNTLKVVRVISCDKMEVLFPLSVMRGLPQLEEIEVARCKLIRGIVEVVDRGKLEFPKLLVLKLRDLPNIKSFFTDGSTSPSRTSDDQVGTQIAFFDGQQVSIPSLELLRMEGLPNLREIWSDESPLELKNLQSLEVVKCQSLSKVISSRLLMNLQKLHTLTIKNCVSVQEIFDLEGPSGSANCETLFELTTFSLEGLQSLRNIWSKNPCGIVSFHNLKKLVVKYCDNLEFMLFSSIVKSLAQLRDLKVVHCKMMKAIIMVEEELDLEISKTLTFPMLTILHLESLESLTCFSHEKSLREAQSHDLVQPCSAALFNGEVAFPSLEILFIKGIDNIELTWDSQAAADSFHKLKFLSVDECNRLKCIWNKELHHQVHCLRSVRISRCENLASLFPPTVAEGLIQLEVLEINACGFVELIEKEEALVSRFDFPKLTSLKLINLTELRCIYTGINAFQWPALKTLNVHGCNKVEILASQPENEMSLRRRPLFLLDKVAFSRLGTLEIIGLDNLRFIFFPSMVKSLAQLSILTVSKCNKMEAIIMKEEGLGLETTGTPTSPIEGEVAFDQLQYIQLEMLRELRCFSSGGHPLTFPLLETIEVGRCPNMKFFSEGQIEAPNLKNVQAVANATFRLTNSHNFWEGNLNIAIQNMFEEMGTFAGVEEMWLSEFPELIERWQSKLNPISSSWQLNSLVVDKCQSFVNAIPPKFMLVLDNLRTLQVHNCELLEEIFNLEGLEAMENPRVLPQLETLTLGYLPKLRQLWNKDLQGMLSFNSLTSLTLYKCSNLRHAFAPSMVECVASLAWMEIKECGQMETVIAEEEGQGSAMEKITFPKLWRIELKCLPNMTDFLLGKSHMLECPRLRVLTIAHCPKMISFTSGLSLFTPQVRFPHLGRMVLSHMNSLSKIWSDNPIETFTFQSLQTLVVQNCMSLENLFPHWMDMSELKNLQLESCGVEEIVASGDDTAQFNTTQVPFPNLTSLVLHDLPRFKGLPTLNWPLLKKLQVTHCDRVNLLSLAISLNKWTQRNDQQELADQEAHSSCGRDFRNLESFSLVHKDIQMIQEEKFPDDIFGKPKSLTLACFHDEGAIFPSKFLLKRFQNLERLEVFCSSFGDGSPNEGLVGEEKHLALQNLRELKLSKLHNLKHVWREDQLVSKILQSIKRFEVCDCPDLTTLFPIVTSFQNLTALVVENSSGLVHLITVSVVMNLAHLTEMTIIGCERMKEVVENDENGQGKVISFGKLKRLTLQQLPSLECFSSTTSCSFKFPSLWSIKVEECPKMKTFSKGRLSTPRMLNASLFGYWWTRDRDEGCDLNAAIQKLSA